MKTQKKSGKAASEKELKKKLVATISGLLTKENKDLSEKMEKVIRKSASEIAKKFFKAKKKAEKRARKAGEKESDVKKKPSAKKAAAKENGVASSIEK